jgi:hypothetical protein
MAKSMVSIIDAATRRVVNLVVTDDGNSGWTPPSGHILGPPGGHIGDTLNADGKSYTRPPDLPKPKALATIGSLQLLRQMRKMGLEAQYQSFLSGLSPVLKADWEEMIQVPRRDPFVNALMQFFSWNDDKMDEVFLAAERIR